MARLPRIDIPGVAQHIVQRGVNRCACFADRRDREFYLSHLGEAAARFECSIHAYVLMTNHVHLLVSQRDTGQISHMMQCLGRNYVRRFNHRYRRTGTLWEGRYKSSLVESEEYLLKCYRYIDLNPVRAAMIQTAWKYEWSSAAANALGTDNPMLVPHTKYLELGNDDIARAGAYRQLLEEGVTQDQAEQIRVHIAQGKVLGSSQFQAEIAQLLGRQVHVRPRGRPRQD